jgi:rhamnosyl/mannosyltransferase
VRFLPWVSGRDLEELLGHAALFVLPSELEGLSLALLDAMAAGVCVLTSDIPENKEVVEGAGFTFRRGDRDDLAVMLDLLIHNPALRRRAAMNERERIQSQYLWPEIAQSIEKVYYHVLGWRDHAPQEQVVDSGSAAASLDRTPVV